MFCQALNALLDVELLTLSHIPAIAVKWLHIDIDKELLLFIQ